MERCRYLQEMQGRLYSQGRVPAPDGEPVAVCSLFGTLVACAGNEARCRRPSVLEAVRAVGRPASQPRRRKRKRKRRKQNGR